MFGNAGTGMPQNGNSLIRSARIPALAKIAQGRGIRSDNAAADKQLRASSGEAITRKNFALQRYLRWLFDKYVDWEQAFDVSLRELLYAGEFFIA